MKTRQVPPRLALRFFRWYCHPKLVDHIEGDLIEMYQKQIRQLGKWKADIRFVIDVLLLFRPDIIKPARKYRNSNEIGMLTNYLKVAVRNMLKYKVYASINVSGLAVGMAASMLIMLYIADELSYDRFHKEADHIFRIGSSGRFEGTEFKSATSSPPIAEALLREVPEVESTTRFGRWRELPMRYNNQVFIEKLTLVADSNFFQFFSFPLTSGDPETALKGTNKVVITEATAKRYFGSENPVGKFLLRGEDRIATEVTGVVKDLPSNSHLQFDMVVLVFALITGLIAGSYPAFYLTAFKPVDVLKTCGVISSTTTRRLPGDRLGRTFGVRLSDAEAKYTLTDMFVDHSFFDTYNVGLLAGRKFIPSDHHADFEKLDKVILNKNAIHLLGIKNPEDAIGKEIMLGDHSTRRWTIVGVVSDFHQEGLQKPLEPIYFMPLYSNESPTSVRVNTQDLSKTIAAIEATYKKFFPGNAFEYSILEDNYKQQYRDDTRFGKIISIFTILAIIVSCLGLIGLSSYTAAQRTKEIGIRKVLGASLMNIVTILSYDFVRLVLIAAIIALPIAYFSMHNWLQGYAYRITPNWTQFVFPVGIVLTIAAVTISFQVLKTAMTNPAETIKYE